MESSLAISLKSLTYAPIIWSMYFFPSYLSLKKKKRKEEGRQEGRKEENEFPYGRADWGSSIAAATAQIQSLAWEHTYATSVAQKIKIKNKKRERKKIYTYTKIYVQMSSYICSNQKLTKIQMSANYEWIK